MDYNIEEAFVARATETIDCSACCFKNFELSCRQMTCWDEDFKSVFWTLGYGTESDIPGMWEEYVKGGKNLKDICLAKIAKAHNR
jgi:hypothetical protein